MPGIVGIIGTHPQPDKKSVLVRMVQCMMHERFYTSQTYVNEPLGLWAGCVSHAGSFSDGMPVWNEARDICLFFSGEEFGDHAEVNGRNGMGNGNAPKDASYLVQLYEKQGVGFLEKLNGWFSGVLVDLRAHRIILFNDRYGLNRIYYHENERGFYFASEAKSLLRVLPELRELAISSLGELFSCGCVLQNRTLFSKVSLVPGGSIWTFSPGQRMNKDAYFRKEDWENQPTLDPEEYYARLKETFARILPRYARRNEKIALSLTGGIDTRMIMAWSPRPPYKLPCFTFGGTYRECNDVKAARRVAQAGQQRHEIISINRKFFSDFAGLAKRTVYLTDGMMDVSGSVELFINRLAREIAPIRLTGNYGDEVMRGGVAFRPYILPEGLLDTGFALHVQAAAQTYTMELQCRRHSFVAFKQVPWYHSSRLSLERSQLTIRSPFLDNDLVALAYQTPACFATSNEPALRLIADGNPVLSRIATDRGVVYPPVPMLTRVRKLYELLTFKAEYAYDYGMPQWLARFDHTLSPLHLERLFLGRHKFYHFRVWYRDELSQYVRDVLLDTRTRQRPYLRGHFLEEMVTSHIQGKRNYTKEIHKVLTSELIQRQLIEQKWS